MLPISQLQVLPGKNISLPSDEIYNKTKKANDGVANLKTLLKQIITDKELIKNELNIVLTVLSLFLLFFCLLKPLILLIIK